MPAMHIFNIHFLRMSYQMNSESTSLMMQPMYGRLLDCSIVGRRSSLPSPSTDSASWRAFAWISYMINIKVQLARIQYHVCIEQRALTGLTARWYTA